MKIIALTFNPAIDIHCHAPVFRAEHENKATITETHAGGKGINVVRALAAVGVDALTVIAVGRQNGKEFLARLARDKVRYKAVFLPGKVRENITVHPDTGHETRLSFAGPAADARLLEKVARMLEKDVNEDLVLTVTGSNPTGLSMADMQAFLAPLRERGVKLVIDSNAFLPDDLRAARPFLIKPNEEEIAAYLKKDAITEKDVLDFARGMHADGIENVMVSLGGRGAYLVCSKGAYFAAAPHIAVVSTIGAGDSSIAGFLAAARAEKPSAECLATAVAFGSAACLAAGTCPPKKQDIRRLMREITVTEV